MGTATEGMTKDDLAKMQDLTLRMERAKDNQSANGANAALMGAKEDTFWDTTQKVATGIGAACGIIAVGYIGVNLIMGKSE